jgi:hypothetical protein
MGWVPVMSVPMKFPSAKEPSPSSNSSASPRLPEMTFPAPSAVPPARFPAPDTTTAMLPNAAPRPLGRGWVPVISVPMKFPATTLPVVGGPPADPMILIPKAELPEMTFRSAGIAPPTVLTLALAIWMPSAPLPSRDRPSAVVPIRFPRISDPLALFAMTMPQASLSEMTFPAPASSSPMSVWNGPSDERAKPTTSTPLAKLLTALIPTWSMPMKLP